MKLASLFLFSFCISNKLLPSFFVAISIMDIDFSFYRAKEVDLRKTYKYASIFAALSLSGLGGAALVLHDKNVQGTVSDDVYWRKVAKIKKQTDKALSESESVDDLIKLADRINNTDSTGILSKNATKIVRVKKHKESPNILVPENVKSIVDKAEQLADSVNKDDTNTDKKDDTNNNPQDNTETPDIKNGWNTDHSMFYVDSVPVTGEYEIDGQTYLFDKDGIAWTGFASTTDKDGNTQLLYYDKGLLTKKRKEVDGSYYYFDDTNGYMVRSQWVKDRYYDEDGHEAHGLTTIDDRPYYFYDDGRLAIGYHTEEYNGQKIRCYSSEDTSSAGDYGVKQFGTITVNGKTIQLDPITGAVYEGSWKGDTYYDKDGNIVKGQKIIGGRHLLFKDNGEMVKGWYEKDGKFYYCDPNSGEQAFGLGTIKESDTVSNTYFFDKETGESMKAGWHDGSAIDVSGKVYFKAQQGKGAYLLKGRQEIDGKAYYFDEDSGVLQVNCRDKYYTDKDGVIQTGPQTIDGKTVYFDDKTGERLEGWVQKDGKTYYYGENGMAKGKITIDGVAYEFDETTGELKTKGFVDGRYINDDGSVFQGEKEVDGSVYYFDPNNGGKYAVGPVTIPADKSLSKKTTAAYFDENGKMVTGKVDLDGETYWYDKNLGRVTNALIKSGNDTYYFQEDGTLFKSGVRYIDNDKKRITADENGVVTKIENLGGSVDSPLLPKNGNIEWHSVDEYETHAGNPFARPWCTWWAWNRFYEVYGYDSGARGNGCTNVSEILRAHPDKFKSSTEPVAGAVFSVPAGVLGGAAASAGHVGFVEKVEGDYIYTSEGGFSMTVGGTMGVAYCKYTKAQFFAKYPGATFAVPR